jgi:two-component system KDP operon response regulator KdpE
MGTNFDEPETATPVLRVLVVEDDPVVRFMTARMIEVLGHTAVAVAGGEEAENLPVESVFDVVLADLGLRGTPGHRLVERLRKRWPDVRASIMSGYLEDDGVRAGHRDGRWRLLQKPFSFETLAAELREPAGPWRNVP